MMKGFDERLDWVDVIAGIGAALLSGGAYNCIRRLKFSEDSHVIILYFPMVAFPITLAYTLLGPGWVTPNLNELGLLVLIGVLTQIAQYFLTRAYQSEMANKVAAVSNLGVIYALAVGYFLVQRDVFCSHYRWYVDGCIGGYIQCIVQIKDGPYFRWFLINLRISAA